MIRKKTGLEKSIGAIHEMSQTFMDDKADRGRPAGTRNTTKQEDKLVLQVFKKLRPPGAGIDARPLN